MIENMLSEDAYRVKHSLVANNVDLDSEVGKTTANTQLDFLALNGYDPAQIQ
jgi:hypothetical protein